MQLTVVQKIHYPDATKQIKIQNMMALYGLELLAGNCRQAARQARVHFAVLKAINLTCTEPPTSPRAACAFPFRGRYGTEMLMRKCEYLILEHLTMTMIS